MDQKNICDEEKKINQILGKHLSDIINRYNEQLEVAKFTYLEDLKKTKQMIEVGEDKAKDLVYFLDGQRIQVNQKFLYLFISTLDPKISTKMYTLVFFIGDDNSTFGKFRELLKELPPLYYIRLKAMYVYHASLSLRSSLSLLFENSKRGKLWKKKIHSVADLNELFKNSIFHKRWIDEVPQNIKEGKDLKQLIQQRNQSIQLNPGQAINCFLGHELESYEMNEFGIPVVLDQLLGYFLKNPLKLQEQWLFRKSGSISQEQELIQLLSQKNYKSLELVNDPNLVASIIKKFFVSLPKPLITYKLYSFIISQIPHVKQSDFNEFLHLILSQMNLLNKIILQLMVSFLLYVTDFAEFNQMTIQYMVIVIVPCFLKPEEPSTQDLEHQPTLRLFLEQLFNNFKTLYPQINFKSFLTVQIDNKSSASSASSQGIDEKPLHSDGKLLEEPFDDELSIGQILKNVKDNKPIQMKSSKGKKDQLCQQQPDDKNQTEAEKVMTEMNLQQNQEQFQQEQQQ